MSGEKTEEINKFCIFLKDSMLTKQKDELMPSL